MRRAGGHNATGQGPAEPTEGAVPSPGRTCLQVKRSPVHLRPSRLVLAAPAGGPRRDTVAQQMRPGGAPDHANRWLKLVAGDRPVPAVLCAGRRAGLPYYTV